MSTNHALDEPLVQKIKSLQELVIKLAAPVSRMETSCNEGNLLHLEKIKRIIFSLEVLIKHILFCVIHKEKAQENMKHTEDCLRRINSEN